MKADRKVTQVPQSVAGDGGEGRRLHQAEAIWRSPELSGSAGTDDVLQNICLLLSFPPVSTRLCWCSFI